uniref:SAP domain-containing protein n=1 Tax=Wuchereria bancrofti TaxID=6293 RepID=A0AAF5PPJ5_WUCBA
MDDSDFVEKSLKSIRELKDKSESEIISKSIIRSDYLLPGGDKDKCFELKNLDELRKSLHINHCLDQQEACNKYEIKKEEWKKVVDCPICGEPLQSGPFRAAHAKRCGKKHHVNPNSLLLLLDTQNKVAEAKKRNGIPHTKLKKPRLEIKKRPVRLSEEPHSLFDEQMKLVTALSKSVCSNGSELHTKTHVIPQDLSKMKSEKQQPRSFVELEPRACKCEVIERIQENFLRIFQTRDEDIRIMLKKNIQNTEKVLKNAGVCVRKFNSLKQLADDLASFSESNSDVIILSRENETFLACRFIIAARAPTLLQHLNSDGSLKLREYSGAAIRSYMTFLTSASVIWTENEREEVHSMAVKYGPKGLAALCKTAKLRTSSNKETVEHYPETDVNMNCDDLEEASNKEKIEEIKGRQDSDAKRKVYDDGMEETKEADLDDPSIIFVEEVERSSENLAKPSSSEFLNSNGNKFIIGSSDLLGYSVLNCRKSSMNEKCVFSEKGIVKLSKPNNSLLVNTVDSDAVLSSSSLIPYASINLNAMGHLNDSIESLLKKPSPIEPPSLLDEEFPSPAACSRQTVTDNLSDNLSPEKLLILPPSAPKSEKTRKSLIKTKSKPEFSFIPKKSSPLLSSLPFLDRSSVSQKNVSSSPEKKRIRIEKTPIPKASIGRLIRRLEEQDSDVKILKTKNVTPIPVYDSMDDKELKAELAKFGIRPMGKKRAVVLLKKIYEETHPVLESTPLSRKSKIILNSDKVEPSSDEDCDVDKTLNASLDECDIMEESCMNDEQSAVLPKDLEGMQNVLLNWLRKEENSSLYNHLLSLNVISFEEFANRLAHADSTVSQIPKKALLEILDRLHVTFRLPMDGWDRKRRPTKR